MTDLATSVDVDTSRAMLRHMLVARGIDDEAERCAAWIADRFAREEQADEISRQMLDQLVHGKDRPQ